MRLQTLGAPLLLAAGGLAAPADLELASSSKCTTGVHLIVARGSLQTHIEGTLAGIAKNIVSRIPGSDSVGVDWPARIHHYFDSVNNGSVTLTKMIQDYAHRCPDSKMALLGYSQGAQIIGDALCGTSEDKFKKTPPLAAKYGRKIVAVVQFADPSFVAGLPYDAGTSTKSGKFPRKNTKACMPYQPVLKSFCDKNDLFCAHGNSLQVHLSYVMDYSTQASDWIVKQWGQFKKMGNKALPVFPSSGSDNSGSGGSNDGGSSGGSGGSSSSGGSGGSGGDAGGNGNGNGGKSSGSRRVATGRRVLVCSTLGLVAGLAPSMWC